jgi:hypothetical protein
MTSGLPSSSLTLRPTFSQVARRTARTSAQRAGRGAKPRRNELVVLEGQIDVSHCRLDAYDEPARPARRGMQLALVAERRCGASA